MPKNKKNNKLMVAGPMDTSCLTLNQEKMNELWRIFETDHNMKKCTQILTKYIFAEEITVAIQGVSIQLDDNFKNHLGSHWLPFGKKLLKWILCIGIAPIMITNVDGEKTPQVLENGTGNIISIMNGGVQYFKWLERKNYAESEIDERVYIAESKDYNPFPDGNFKSIVNSLVQHEKFLQAVKVIGLTNLKTRAQPPILIQRSKGSYANKKADKLTYFAENPTRAVTKRTTDNDMENDILNELLRNLDEEKMMQHNTIHPTEYIKVGYNPNSNIYKIPENYESGSYQLPDCNINFVELEKHYTTKVCDAFNVPVALLGEHKNSNTNVHSALSVNDMFQETITYYRSIVSDIMTTVYTMCYGSEKTNWFIVNTFQKSKTNPHKRQKISSKEKIYAKPKIVFQHTPFVKYDDLKIMYKDRVITREEFVNSARRRYGYTKIDASILDDDYSDTDEYDVSDSDHNDTDND
ncbi:MAG: hypothetical protein EOP34_03790, partial [Rickettsiales bacterium]